MSVNSIRPYAIWYRRKLIMNGPTKALIVQLHHHDAEYLEMTMAGFQAGGTGEKLQYFLGPEAGTENIELCGSQPSAEDVRQGWDPTPAVHRWKGLKSVLC